MQSVLLRAAGLYTFPNSLSEIPPGSLTTADNVVIDRNGIIEQRRGFQQYGTTFGLGTDRVKQLMQYKDRILRHWETTVDYDSTGTGVFLPFSGSFLETEEGLRIKYIEANGNLYFTTATGIQCISATSASEFTTALNYIRPAGGIQALDVNGIVDYSGGGWFIYQTNQPGQTKVAYRVTWGFNDPNGNFVEGAPSSRLVLTNFSTVDSANVELTFQIPSQISSTDTQFFYRIYRTAIVQTSVGVTLSNLDPGDEMNLVIQDFPSSAQLTARSVTLIDNVPESFRRNGALLYTNPVSGEGILQANYAPPIAKDINLFQNTTFYANTQTIQQLNLALLSVDDFVSGSSYIFILDGTVLSITSFVGLVTANTINFPNTYSLNDEVQYTTVGTPITGLTNEDIYYIINPTPTSFQLSTTPSGPPVVLTSNGVGVQNFSSGIKYTFVGTKQIQELTFNSQAATTDGGYFLINAASDVRKYFVWFNKSGTPEITNFQFDTVANTTDGGYFLINSANDINKYFVWMDKTGSTVPPTGPDTFGRVGIRVPLAGLVSAAQVATAVSNVISNSDFSTSVATDTVQTTNNVDGTTTLAVDGAVPVGGIFNISSVQLGSDPTTQPNGADTVGRLPIPIDIKTATTDADVALAVATELSLVVDFQATSLGAVVTVTNTDNGACDAAVDSVLVPTPLVGPVVVTQLGTGEDASIQQVLLGGSLSPSQNIDETARSLVKVINSTSASAVDAFYQSGPTDLPGLILLQARNLAQSAFSVIADSTTTGNEFSPALPTSGTSISSSNLVQLNALYYSKFQQPEAVPIVNNFLVGPKDKAILRILPLRSGLMIIKEDGIYRLTGTNGQFQIDPFDNSAICLAADSAQILNNQIYMFSTQGVVTLTDTGVSVISRPIEDKLNKIVTPEYDFKPNTFGVAYESDRAYLMWTVTNTNDTQPTQCFRYNTFTNAWTRWPIVKTAGTVLFSSQILYLAPGDENFIEIERKNIDRTDYADRVYPLQIPANSIINSTTITLSSVDDVEAGDVLAQTQFLTIYQFNQLLKMLDSDIGTGYHDYYDLFAQSAGADLRTALDELATRMDTDPGLNETDFFSSMTHGTSFADYQIDFNILTALLNINPNTNYSNYVTSTGTVVFEMLVTALIQNTNNIEVQFLVPIIQGGILGFRGIPTNVTWAPQTFGDPSISKHVSEGTFMFDNTSFFGARISYASDLMPGFEPVDFPELGIGDWGDFVWNGQTWGGEGTGVPLRTYIPRNKQYCRYLRPNFSHSNAREKYALLGGSLTFRPLTERAYRS